jgi:hypothetical protein
MRRDRLAIRVNWPWLPTRYWTPRMIRRAEARWEREMLRLGQPKPEKLSEEEASQRAGRILGSAIDRRIADQVVGNGELVARLAALDVDELRKSGELWTEIDRIREEVK